MIKIISHASLLFVQVMIFILNFIMCFLNQCVLLILFKIIQFYQSFYLNFQSNHQSLFLYQYFKSILLMSLGICQFNPNFHLIIIQYHLVIRFLLIFHLFWHHLAILLPPIFLVRLTLLHYLIIKLINYFNFILYFLIQINQSENYQFNQFIILSIQNHQAQFVFILILY